MLRRCIELALAFGHSLDKILPGCHFEENLLNGKEMHVLRILAYDPPSEGTVLIGKRHYDRSAFTIKIADSHSGLRFIGDESVVESHPGKVLIFSGVKSETRSGGIIKPLEHEVIGTAAGKLGRRWSIVFFAHTPDPYPAWFKENV